MPDKKKLRIGVTVNLENYENLRIEVEGDISGDESPDELINYLDMVLGKFGSNDPDTKKRVDSYRRRVTGQRGEECRKSEQTKKREEESLKAFSPGETEIKGKKRKKYWSKGTTPGSDLKSTDISGEKENYPERVSESPEGIIRYKENNKIINKTTICEICGSAVTPQTEHASKVIAGRVLCRRCLEGMKRDEQ
ncbi:hypothetical protein [Methanoplanus limicola]|uniref:Uncharacterized protein n=1 Tax=Methanoplanus limicola DSM 2279 TaxID=937775 RepID=H1Z1B5_9EURY|nr:hypothetical protein [Methanoplanus limicola]EHQ35382.1 hypothetical protein Metlim_1273 [Methanoplanus limicola DSM 2279]